MAGILLQFASCFQEINQFQKKNFGMFSLCSFHTIDGSFEKQLSYSSEVSLFSKDSGTQ